MAADRNDAVIARAAAVATVAVLPVFLTGAMAVQMGEDLGFDEAGLGLTVAAFFGGAAAASAASGRLAERVGPARAMRVGCVMAAVSLGGIAFLARSFVLLLLFLIVGGLANSVAQPSSNLWLARLIPASRLGIAFGIKQSAIPAATLLGGLAVPAVALTVGWRWAFAAGAVLAVALAVLHPAREVAPGAAVSAGRGEGDTPLDALVLLAVGVGLGAAAAGTLGSFLVSAGVEAGMAEGRAGLMASACSAGGLVVRLSAGVMADRRGRRHLPVVSAMLAAGAIGYATISAGTPTAVVLGGAIAFCLGWSWPGLFNLAIVRNNPGAPGAATGITQTGTYIGAVLGPVLFGQAVQRSGYELAWLGAAVVSTAAAVAVMAGRRKLIAANEARAEPEPVAPPAPM